MPSTLQGRKSKRSSFNLFKWIKWAISVKDILKNREKSNLIRKTPHGIAVVAQIKIVNV